jgi:hypothetical protein
LKGVAIPVCKDRFASPGETEGNQPQPPVALRRLSIEMLVTACIAVAKQPDLPPRKLSFTGIL